MKFLLFILLNVTLFIRPAEIVPSLEGLPIYNALMLICLAVAHRGVIGQLRPESLRGNPLTVFTLGILVAVVLSHASHGDVRLGVEYGVEFLKVVLYYLVLVAVIDTPARLDRFLGWLAVMTLGLTVLAVLNYHGIMSLPGMEAAEDLEIDPKTGALIIIRRMTSTGIYSDPNDLCMILLVAMGICVFRTTRAGAGLRRVFWVGSLGLFGYALALTHSRGGFIALLAAIFLLFYSRFGWRRAIPLGMLVLPVVLVLFGGRQTNLTVESDTGQDRIQLWAQGWDMFKGAPLFGIGIDRYAEEAGLVAHNSYVHGFAEMGFFGGSLFLGSFFYAIWALGRLKSPDVEILDPEMGRLRPYLMAMEGAYAAGMLTLSRNYIVPTYMILGLVTSYMNVAGVCAAEDFTRVSRKLLGRVAAVSVVFLVAVNIFIRVFARFG